MRVDELNFRTSRKHEAIAKYGGTQCLVGVCSGSDDQAHVESCFGYKLQLHADTLFDNINIANSLCQDLLVLSITSSIHQSFTKRIENFLVQRKSKWCIRESRDYSKEINN